MTQNISIIFREAKKEDIPLIQEVRNSVKENSLSDPLLVTDEAVHDYLFHRGKGWVCEVDGQIIGFSIASVKDRNVWALFIHPEHEKRGIGRKLHDLMINWYFDQTSENIWLSTSPGTRAEIFYRKAGWTETGSYGKGEIKFEMRPDQWRKTVLI